MNDAYGEEAPSVATVKRWLNEFKRGRTSVLDDERSGRPPEIDEKITQKCQEIVQSERRITTRELKTRLYISKGTVHNILRSLGVRKLCSRFVPHFLTAEMQARRLKSCKQNIACFNQLGERFLDNIITMDETPLSLYLPESKRESAEWKLPGETSSRKLRSGTSHRKAVMLSVFWDSSGVILIDFLDSGNNIDGKYYSDLVVRARKKRRKSRLSELYYLADNAPAHTSAHSSSVLSSTGLVVLEHPPYSPDLAPSDFYLFTHLKQHLRGTRFNDKDELKTAVTDFFDSKPQDFFKKAFSELYVRWKKCIAEKGSYIEK